jgi:hypothetical protein
MISDAGRPARFEIVALEVLGDEEGGKADQASPPPSRGVGTPRAASAASARAGWRRTNGDGEAGEDGNARPRSVRYPVKLPGGHQTERSRR